MDALDGCSFIDDLILDLPLDISDQNPKAEEQEDEENLQSLSKKSSFASKIGCNDALDDFCDAADECFPDFLEELEWLTNEDAFPTVETSAISSDKPSVGPKQQSPVSVLECSGVRVPVRARSNRSRRRRRVSCFSGMWSEPKRCVQSPEGQTLRKCLHCFAEKTPQWRAGPLGPKTLCNACGVRYKSGRLVPEYRPASSPTFSSDVHSNSHRKILEMRRSKQPFR